MSRLSTKTANGVLPITVLLAMVVALASQDDDGQNFG